MRFREWMEDSCLLNEMPYARIEGDPSMILRIANKSQAIKADLVDFRFEDYGSLGRSAPPNGLKHFAAPLGNGRWLNVDLDSFPYGRAWVDTERAHELTQNRTTEPYQTISKDWASFAEFLFGNEITKNAQAGAMRANVG